MAAKKKAAARKTSAKKKSPARSKPADTPSAPEGAASERLHKFLASTGAGSRRECEVFIQQGRVSVNGKTVTKMGTKVDPTRDVVLFDGERAKQQDKVYYLLYKPSGYICTNSDERGRPRAVDLIGDDRHRIYTVGRLDGDSRGLVLVTNDGLIANIVCHPRYRIEKVYQVQVRGIVTRQHVARLEAGVWLAEGKASPARVRPIGKNERRQESLLEVTLFEGRNREIRRVFNKVGLKVKRLIRSRIGPLTADGLEPGKHRVLTTKDLQFVYDAEQLYLANQELWDAEMPPERPRRRWWKKKPAKKAAAKRPAGRPSGRRPAGRPPARRPDVRVRDGDARSGESGPRRRYYS